MNNKLIALAVGVALSSGAVAMQRVSVARVSPESGQRPVQAFDSIGIHPPQMRTLDSIGIHPPQVRTLDSIGIHPPQVRLLDSYKEVQ